MGSRGVRLAAVRLLPEAGFRDQFADAGDGAIDGLVAEDGVDDFRRRGQEQLEVFAVAQRVAERRFGDVGV